MRLLTILAALIFSLSGTASAVDFACSSIAAASAAALTSSTRGMSDVLCKAAEDGRFQPSSQSLLGSCGQGAAISLATFAKDVVNLAEAAGDLTVASLDRASHYISSLWAENSDAAMASEKAADANAAESQTWLQTVKNYYAATQLLIEGFFSALAENARLVGTTVSCLPWKFKIDYACQFLSSVALDLGSLKAVVAATKGGIATVKTASAVNNAVRDFVEKTNLIAEMKDLTVSERLTAGASALKEQMAFKTVDKFGSQGNLLSRIDPITQEQTFHVQEIATVNGQKVAVVSQLFSDAKTGAIDANSVKGKLVAKLTVGNAQGNMLIFGDVGNLGKVNYFKAGTQAGDFYLERVGLAIRKNLRAEDRFFKNGGDELIIVFKTTNPEDVKQFIQRVYKAIEDDKELNQMFKDERIAKRNEILASNRTSPNKIEILRPPSAAQIAALQETAKIRPNISMGATVIRGDFSGDLVRAEKQATIVKKAYKEAMGSPSDKYGGERIELLTKRPRFNAKPMVLDPVE